MRFVVYGAGAIGGVVGGRLHTAGHEVVLIARGAQLEAIRERGLRLDDPGRLRGRSASRSSATHASSSSEPATSSS